jgi:hypothetical protein
MGDSMPRRLNGLRVASGLLFCGNLLILCLSPLLIYSLPPYPARVLLFTVVLSPLIWLYHYSRSTWVDYSESVIFRFLAFLGVTSFIYLLFNMLQFGVLGEGVMLSEVAMLAEEYGRQGVIVRTSSHSYFFQAPFLAYMLNQVCGVPAHYAVFMEQAVIILLLALLSMYVHTRIRVMIPNQSGFYRLLACVVPLALIASGTRIWVPGLNVNYRDIGSYLAMFAITYSVANGLTRRQDYVTVLLLVLGVVFGSPPAGIVVILFFAVYSLLTKRVGPMVYAILPVFYIVSSAGLYLRSLIGYGEAVLEGFLFAIVAVLAGTDILDQNERLYVVPYGDRTLETLTYFAVLGIAGLVILLRFAGHLRRPRVHIRDLRVVALVVVLLSTLLWIFGAIDLVLYLAVVGAVGLGLGLRFVNRLLGLPIQIRDPRYATLYIVVVVTLLVTVFVTLGATVMPETTFSDIRTIVFSFLLVVLPVVFVKPPLYRQLQRLRVRRLVLTVMVVLLCAVALLKPSSLFPKSLLDESYVVEDRRLSQTIGYAKTFLFESYPMGTVTFDYKSHLQIVRFMVVNRTFGFREVFYNVSLLSKLETLENRIAFFDQHGVTEPSLYLTRDDYQKAYNLSLAANIVFNDGRIIISTQ